MSFNFISQQLSEKKQLNLYRQRNAVEQGVGRILLIDQQQYINFSSNDYLGLGNHADIQKAYIKGIEQYGNGSCSSSLVTGYSKAHQELEETLADWLGFERALLFSSGFSANSGILQALAKKNDLHYLLDKLSHASLIDGAFNSSAKSQRFRHNSVAHLKQRLENSSSENILTIVEGVYSMDGDCAPLDDILTLNRQHNAWLYVDDAHGLGVLGQNGQGTLAAKNIVADHDIIQMSTFGKALGTSGAAICGSNELVDYAVNFARDYTYSTAIPPAVAMATLASIKLCKAESWRREKLSELTAIFKNTLDKSIEITASDTAIIGVIIGSEIDTVYCANELKKHGFWLTAIRPPTVEQGRSRLRVTINSNHKASDIIGLANSINEVVYKCLKVT